MTTWSSSTDQTPPIHLSGNSAEQRHPRDLSRGLTLSVLFFSADSGDSARGFNLTYTFSEQGRNHYYDAPNCESI
ncbi:hypothetical protein DPMN_191588 [Dreissena polymorpha]|uniref:Uncharacterized protein n=1 Tax=Dreissena polymorpha TaxID=45954 RepID=A0A9D3Y1K1_DREPO|nr:hypothetical protein DPMN_191588 [Dreissena polymorpha]